MRSILSNLTNLAVIQIANVLLPLVTIPHLANVLGLTQFGNLTVALSLAAIISFVSDYGLNVTVPRAVSMCDKSGKSLGEILAAVYVIRISIWAIALCALLIVTALLQDLATIRGLIIASALSVLANLVAPTWFFQGLEKNGNLAIALVMAKFSTLLSVLIFVRDPTDAHYFPVMTFVWTTFFTLLTMRRTLKRYCITLQFPNQSVVRQHLKDGWDVFVTSISVSTYTLITPILVGIILGPSQAGIYSIADKFVQAGKAIYVPFSQALFPIASRRFRSSFRSGTSFVFKSLAIIVPIMLGTSVFLHLSAESLVGAFFEPQYANSSIILQALSILPLIVAVGNVFILLGLYNLNESRVVTRFTLKLSLLHPILLIVLLRGYGLLGGAVAIIITETFICIFAIKSFFARLSKED